MKAEQNPCISCGACCTRYRVSFHWSETTLGDGHVEREPGGPRVPVELTEHLGPHRNAMKGTLWEPVRCIALEGEVGCSARCSIHPIRPSPCREFPRSWEDGEHNERCDAARAAFGLPPLPRPDEAGETPGLPLPSAE
ncbi:MAG: YkgJ family cysteine cluster protein [Candidatus Eisenbacteria bacterium]|uniref:YkgJ family cysteine cluster protein n=1 Tax=Eiseniibacteriota bacterium TaxID=2212470 RepID=A0A956NCB7_UNCEI|nr:YkgJ family cysteine cluster protein [Candidatus Eisenbacteria bacterium]MCB9462191.1 YkgJ family cysteine cluster protein [Candidatus Eisenbacteria bacterium]